MRPRSADPEQTPTVAAFGDADDHLRLTVLLAGALQRFEPDAASVCRQAEKNPWPQRLDAFKELLRAADTSAARVERPLVRVADVYALPRPRPGLERWDDGPFLFERSALRRALESRPSVIALDRADPLPPDASVYDRFEPSLRPIARHIVARDWVDEHSLEAYLRLGRPQHVLVVVWDWLPPFVQDAALRLSALRPPQRLNGVLGPFPLRAARADASAEFTLSGLDRATVDELLTAGLLQNAPARPGHVLFPRVVREFLRSHAGVFPEDTLRRDHGEIARGIGGESDDAVIERHHHAVLAGDVQLALDTARFYGADLRAAGTAASFERRYDDAARIFRTIVERFDPKDGYAWEYLGFNLWWPHRTRPQRMPPTARDEALRALERACTVDARGENNPLFRGRLLGFRGALGEDIGAEFNRWLKYFVERFRRHPGQLTWFIDAVRGALRRAGRESTYTALCASWRKHPVVGGMLADGAPDTDASGG